MKILTMVIALGLIVLPGIVLAQEEAVETVELSREVTIVSVEGTASIKKADTEEWVPASAGDILGQGDMLRTDPLSTVDLNFDGSGQTARVKVSENAEIAFDKLTWDSAADVKETILDLAIGSILIRASRLERESKFEVNTPTSIVGVRGTTFEVRVSAAE